MANTIIQANPVSLAKIAGMMQTSGFFPDTSGLLPASGGTITGLASKSVALNYAAPLTGTTVSLTGAPFAVIEPAGTLAALTVALPSSPTDGLAIVIGFTRAITAITWSNGTVAAVAPATIAAGTHVQAVYRAASSRWFIFS